MARETRNEEIFRRLVFPLGFVVLMWICHIINVFTFSSLNTFGVYPREMDGLWGILFAPLIHGDWMHLISNTMPMLILGSMLFLFYRTNSFTAFVLIYFLTGLMVWIFARPSYHIGASGVVYGLVTFIFWSGIFRRNVRSIVLSLVILVLYSGYFIGIFPMERGVSWESHLLGATVGIFVAFLLKNNITGEEDVEEYSSSESNPREYFLDRDTFVHTKSERRRIKENRAWNRWLSTRTDEFPGKE